MTDPKDLAREAADLAALSLSEIDDLCTAARRLQPADGRGSPRRLAVIEGIRTGIRQAVASQEGHQVLAFWPKTLAQVELQWPPGGAADDTRAWALRFLLSALGVDWQAEPTAHRAQCMAACLTARRALRRYAADQLHAIGFYDPSAITPEHWAEIEATGALAALDELDGVLGVPPLDDAAIVLDRCLPYRPTPTQKELAE